MQAPDSHYLTWDLFRSRVARLALMPFVLTLVSALTPKLAIWAELKKEVLGNSRWPLQPRIHVLLFLCCQVWRGRIAEVPCERVKGASCLLNTSKSTYSVWWAAPGETPWEHWRLEEWAISEYAEIEGGGGSAKWALENHPFHVIHVF